MPAGLRARLPILIVVLVALGLAVAATAFNLVLARSLSGDATALARSRAEATATALDVRRGRIVAEPGTSGTGSPVWTFSAEGVRIGPGAGAALDRAARAAAAAPGRAYSDVEPGDLRLVAVPALAGGRRLGSVVGAASLAPYERTRRIALVASAVLVGVLLLLIAISTRWTVGAALRPVARMTADAEDWSEHDLDRRFGLGPPRDELTRLAATLDDLLGRLASSLRREQRLTAELSHELRTPLSKVITQAELALRREREPSDYAARIASMLANARSLAATMETLLAAARHDANGQAAGSDAGSVVAAVVRGCEPLAQERGVRLRAADPRAAVGIGIDAPLAERILHPVVENACRYARAEVRVAVAARDGVVTIAVEDDGPGVPVAERELVFEPGRRGSVGRASDASGAGLGLPLARRLARTAGGDVGLVPDRGGRFDVRLPAARAADAPSSPDPAAAGSPHQTPR